jgi:hypothetical protein
MSDPKTTPEQTSAKPAHGGGPSVKSQRRNRDVLLAAIAAGVFCLLCLFMLPINLGPGESPRVTAAKVMCHSLEQLCEWYKEEHNDYPLNLEALTQPSTSGKPYLPKVPLNPWGIPYSYEYRPDKPHISTVSPKGVQIDVWP